MDVDQLNILIKGLKCSECHENGLTVELSEEKEGFVRKISLLCSYCEILGLERSKKSVFTSKRIQTQARLSHFDLNIRTSMAFIYMGLGYSAIEQFGMIVNISIPSNNGFKKLQTALQKACIISSNKLIQEARTILRKMYIDLYVEDTSKNQKYVEAAGSYDGSWLTRGHQSKHGLACVIDYLTGYVLDFEVLSKYCHACEIAKKDYDENSPEYALWYEMHAEECSQNHEESSGSMERNIAEIIWKRSEDYGFRFVTMISDGDSSTFSHLSQLNVYGPSVVIKKEECVNHVQRRFEQILIQNFFEFLFRALIIFMFSINYAVLFRLRTALEKLVKESICRGKRLGGKGFGTLTQNKIVKLSSYYKSAIYSNKNNVLAMKNAILATLYHSISTDENPQHSFCPEGKKSWCFYQRALAENTVSGSHVANVGTPIKPEFFDLLLPIYQRLSSEDLLNRCIGCKTQNAKTV